MKDYAEQARFEHLFWLQILGDHARFIRNSLCDSEEETMKKAIEYVHLWDDLLDEVRVQEGLNYKVFSRYVGDKARGFYRFKRDLTGLLSLGQVNMLLSTSFLNHMVNELEEYLLVLSFLAKGDTPPLFHELHHHMLWLMDASWHAGDIYDEIDEIESEWKEKSKMFRDHFQQFHLKATEMKEYLLLNHPSFPALQKLNDEAALELKLFQTFLKELEEMELDKTSLCRSSPLMADHMAREECYYLYKLAEVTDGCFSGCDPTKPRTE
ncbi:DUF2935 domain-containing protein [Halobacillus litoralis]|uniref:DUF2935 domain-containing protein n=1 Tax=Halobacillus litoralis TaxID=45668 RepID=UPI001CFE7A4E|nr:DUF2935 domain-containing protein [Halobacillus litoralis]